MKYIIANCKRCGHIWPFDEDKWQDNGGFPNICPKCKSKLWQVPKEV